MQSEQSGTVDRPTMERLHVLTLFHRLLVSLPALLVILLPVLRGPDTNAWVTVAVVLVYGLFVIPVVLLQYLRFRYAVTPEEIVIHSGVFTYKHRNIPIERIQNIEIEQSLLPRLLGLAKVKIETAGSRSTEGVIEFVSLERARGIRETVKHYQRARDARGPTTSATAGTYADVEGADSGAGADANAGAAYRGIESTESEAGERVGQTHAEDPTVKREDPTVQRYAGGQERRVVEGGAGFVDVERPASAELLYGMSLGRVLLSGAFRFSLLYIAMIFTATEYLGIEPDELARWITGNRLEAFSEALRTSPVLIVFSTILIVALLAWITGILTNLSRYYRFRITYEDGKLHTRQGLLTISEGTIPLRKIQALLIRTNPLMRAFGWYRLELQTMGFDAGDRGSRVAAPFARMDEILAIALRIRRFTSPAAFRPVSRLMIRRTFLRYTLVLLPTAAAADYFFDWGWGLILAIPLLYALAVRQYHNHGYAVEGSHLFVRRGVFRRYTWILPFERFQVFYLTQTLFQRRLELQSLYVDTPGGTSMAQPVVVDMPEFEATKVLESLYTNFQGLFSKPRAVERNE